MKLGVDFMLKVIFSYTGEPPIFETLRALDFKYNEGIYVLKNDKKGLFASITNKPKMKQLSLEFSGELSFEQYKELHLIVSTIATKIQADVNDEAAFMGYLDDGSEVFIYNNWGNWLQFIEGAKHVSMEGQKVQLFNGKELLEEGILIEAVKDKSSQNEFRLLKCTIITKNGEKTIRGDNLKVVVTGEF